VLHLRKTFRKGEKVVKIDKVLSGSQFPDVQRLVLQVLEKHPDEIFSLDDSDLKELAIWCQNPVSNSAPKGVVALFPNEEINSALVYLYRSERIERMTIKGKNYYGSMAAIQNAKNTQKDTKI
jgi:hypothetical protein